MKPQPRRTRKRLSKPVRFPAKSVRSDSILLPGIDEPYARLTQSALSFQKSVEFISKHQRIFSRLSLCHGDADTHFKATLRHNDDYVNVGWVPKKQISRNRRIKHTVSKQSLERIKYRFAARSPQNGSSTRTLTPSNGVNDDMAEDDAVDKADEFFGEGEDDGLEGIQKIIAEANDELEKVVADNEDLLNELGDTADEAPITEDEPVVCCGDQGGSYFQFDPNIEMQVLKELEEAERQAKCTARVISDLKTRIQELLRKEKMTECESKELEEMNRQLRCAMQCFEEKTKRIQALIAQSELFEKMKPVGAPLQQKHNEDVLPKVLVCGTQQGFPKIILCEEKKKRKAKCGTCKPPSTPRPCPDDVVPCTPRRCTDRNKDRTIQYLQQRVCCLEAEMRCLQNVPQPCCGQPPKMAPCGKSNCPALEPDPCPAFALESRMQDYDVASKQLEQQLRDMECEVKGLHEELQKVQTEREHLEQHRQILLCPPCYPPPCSPCGPCGPCGPCPPPPPPCCMPPKTGSCEQQFRELQEQYCRLQDDFKNKLTEVAFLRTDNEKLKTTTAQAEDIRKKAEEKLREIERELKAMKSERNRMMGAKEQMIEMEQQLQVAKQRFREAQDELDELRSHLEDQHSQVNDYRNKYMEAQQQVEEQKRQIDLMELDSSRLAEQVNLEIQRVKNQFQEKLQELAPLPDLLKNTQRKLQEAQQMHLLAEQNNEALNRELDLYKDKVAAFNNQLAEAQSDQQLEENAKAEFMEKIKELEERLEELEQENENIRQQMEEVREAADETDRMSQEKTHEIAQLTAQLESVREESARQVSRNKDRCETVRRSMQNQISDLEQQLAQSRAQARAAQRDRDDIRQKMQAQIVNLHENFEDAQMRIRSLQGHVNFLKSYSNAGDAQEIMKDPCCCAKDQ